MLRSNGPGWACWLLGCLLLGGSLSLPVGAQTYTKTDTHTYEDNLDLWVIGQPGATTNVNTGFVEQQTEYDPATALPLRTYKFGKLQQTLAYYGGGMLKSTSDARDNGGFNTTITFSSWKRGLPQRIDYPDGTYKLLSIDDYGLIRWVEDETRSRTCYDFDAMGRLAQVQYPQEGTPSTCDGTAQNWFAMSREFKPIATTEFGLVPGHWRELVRTSQNYKYVYYDALWRPVVTQSFDNADIANTLSQTVTRYDHDNQPVYQSYPTREAITAYTDALPGTRTTYDALGRPTRVEQDAESDLGVLVSTTTYLGNFSTVHNNPRGKTTVTRYRTLDTPSTDWPVYMQHPGGAYTDITRNTFGLPTSLKRRNYKDSLSAIRTYAYNTAMELCRVVEPETGATLNGYDAAGNLKWSASGMPANSPCDAEGDTPNILNRIVQRDYDQRNRIQTLTFKDGRGNTTYDYTDDGLPESVTVNNWSTNAVTTNYTYNARRLMTSETMVWASLSTPWSVTYGYNKFGNLLVQGYPGGLNVNYAPNALGQATQAGSYATGVKYFANGGIAEFLYGNGIKHTLEQNARLLPERSRDAYGSTAFLDDTYDYDVNGNVQAITDATSGNRGNRTMEYDDLDRLIGVTSPMYSSTSTPGKMTFAYDVLDNITSVQAWNRSLKYCYDDGSNRLTMIRTPSTSSCTTGSATTALEYDWQGNVSSKNNTTYEFDFGNRLRSATDGATSTTYVYDAAGRRVRDITGASRYSLYTQAGQVAYTLDTRKAEATNYVYLGGSLVATSRLPTGSSTPVVEYQHTDALGTPVVVTNASRAIVQKSEYEPYGSVINRPKVDGIGFTGHVEDGATGLTYMQQRYFDTWIGRFLSVDPVTADPVLGGNFNRYGMQTTVLTISLIPTGGFR
jgi:RHS repeat-associated protein